MKIQNKLIVSITGIIIAIVVFTSYLSLTLYKDTVIHLEEDYFSTLLRVFAYSCKVDIDKFVEVLGDDSKVLYAMVLTPEGEVLVHSETDMEGKTLKDPISQSAINANSLRFSNIMWNGKNGIDAAMPISLDKINWGIVRIGFSTENIERKIKDARDFIILLASLAIFFGISMAYILSGKIVRPILSLTKKAGQIAIGRRDVSFKIPAVKYPECNKILNCQKKECPSFDDGKKYGCWCKVGKYSKKWEEYQSFDCYNCDECQVYKKYMSNELNQLIETFMIMYDSIRQKENELIKDENELTKVNSELKKTLKKLLDSETKYKTLAESARDIIFTLDLNGRFTFINRKAQELLGIDAKMFLLNRSFTRILTRESRKIAFETYKKIRSGEETKAFDVSAYRSKGKPLSLELILSPIIEEDVLVGIHGIARDISYRKSLEAQLIQTGKLSSIGELATGVAHELNQPLMIIRGYSQLICSELNKDDEYYKELKFIEHQTGRMAKIINHLRAFARQSEPSFTYININNVIDASLIMVHEHLKIRNIKIVKKYKKDLPYIYGDPSHLEQVFLNLITNARDSMEELGGGVLEFKTEVSPDKKFVTAMVCDSGSGIHEDYLDDIFNPFFTTKEVGKGTGLGLSISYGIIQAHKGTISVHSKSGVGTTFTIELPIIEVKDA